MDGEPSRQQLMDLLHLRDRKHFTAAYRLPALALGVIEMTIPDKPNSRLQKYRLTDAGRARAATFGAVRKRPTGTPVETPAKTPVETPVKTAKLRVVGARKCGHWEVLE